MGGISPVQLLIVLGIVLLLFGSKRLRTLGSDVGEAIRGFRKSVADDEKKDDSPPRGLDSPESKDQSSRERDHQDSR